LNYEDRMRYPLLHSNGLLMNYDSRISMMV